MRTRERTGFPSRALRPGLALALGAAAVVACGEHDATTVTGAGPGPATDVHTNQNGFEIAEARTTAEIELTSSRTDVVKLGFEAELDELATRTAADVVATWEQAGQADPTPFVVTIPEECWVPNAGFHVEDFRDCGVTVMLGEEVCVLMEFEARLVANSDGTARFELIALFVPEEPVVPSEPIAAALLGTVGGAVVEVMIGAEMASAPPREIETVGGVALNDG